MPHSRSHTYKHHHYILIDNLPCTTHAPDPIPRLVDTVDDIASTKIAAFRSLAFTTTPARIAACTATSDRTRDINNTLTVVSLLCVLHLLRGWLASHHDTRKQHA